MLWYSTSIVTIFENFSFDISRYWFGYHHKDYVFNSSSFIFNDINKNTDICYLNSFDEDATWIPSYWSFNDCYFKSNLPVKIFGGNVVNPTINGKIIIA